MSEDLSWLNKNSQKAKSDSIDQQRNNANKNEIAQIRTLGYAHLVCFYLLSNIKLIGIIFIIVGTVCFYKALSRINNMASEQTNLMKNAYIYIFGTIAVFAVVFIILLLTQSETVINFISIAVVIFGIYMIFCLVRYFKRFGLSHISGSLQKIILVCYLWHLGIYNSRNFLLYNTTGNHCSYIFYGRNYFSYLRLNFANFRLEKYKRNQIDILKI